MDSWPINRVLIALENQSGEKAVLEITAELAHALNATLTGIFIINDALANLAELPFTRLVHAHGAGNSKLEAEHIQAQNRIATNKARCSLELCAKRWQIGWSFHAQDASAIEKNAVATEIADLICLQLSSTQNTLSSPNLLDIPRLIQRHPGSLLIAPEKCKIGNELLVIVENEHTLDKVLAPVFRLGAQGKYPVIVVLEKNRAVALKLKQAVEERLSKHNLQAQFMLMSPLNFTTFCQLISKRSPHLVIINLDDPLLANDQIRHLANTVQVPILIVR